MPASKRKTAAAAARAAVTTAVDDTYAPMDALTSAFRFWWVIFVLVVAGGLVGLLVHSLRPPVYEAVARFPASIDFVSAGPLTEREEDLALNAIHDLVISDAVVDKVVETAAAQGISTSKAELKQSALLERRVNVWTLRLRDTDSQRAERLAGLWAEQAQADLLDGYENALAAARLSTTMRSLESCLERAVVGEPSGVHCSSARFSEIQADLREAGAAYTQAKHASRGLSPTLVLGPMDPAVLSPRPVIFERSQVVLAGGLLGLLAGVWLVQSGLAARWLKSTK